jgi:putative PIN family toxin of toxin-antitoxin system
MASTPVVVFDTNVLIPMILPASRATHLFSRLEAVGWSVALSPPLLAEVRDKLTNREPLRRWLKATDAEVQEFLTKLPAITRQIPGNAVTAGAVPADPKDDMVVAAAVESGASYIVSEDHHLRDLKDYQGIKILGIDEFKAELDRLGLPAAEH